MTIAKKHPEHMLKSRKHSLMSEEMRKIIVCMQEAVDAEMERKAKLGYCAVIADRNDRPKIVSAKYLVRKLRARKKGLHRKLIEMTASIETPRIV